MSFIHNGSRYTISRSHDKGSRIKKKCNIKNETTKKYQFLNKLISYNDNIFNEINNNTNSNKIIILSIIANIHIMNNDVNNNNNNYNYYYYYYY